MTDTGLEFGELEALKTTNARDEKWSSWIDWSGGECPLPDDVVTQVKLSSTPETERLGFSERWKWNHNGLGSDIIAYRYRMDDNAMTPESGMHPDLEWLAIVQHEWEDEYTHAYVIHDNKGIPQFVRFNDGQGYTKPQWLQARKDLGLIMSDAEEEMDVPEWAGSVLKAGTKYSPYFKDVSHLDRIDVYRVVSLFDCEKHGHAISHAVKKLLLTGVRTGGKGVETEVREAIDSLNRWLEMREEDKRA